eukprot:m.270485 g.270485  ORF g.270485 m.270485 type:complete len:1035 (-) comp90404_c0_seq1:8-3112(-)
MNNTKGFIRRRSTKSKNPTSEESTSDNVTARKTPEISDADKEKFAAIGASGITRKKNGSGRFLARGRLTPSFRRKAMRGGKSCLSPTLEDVIKAGSSRRFDRTTNIDINDNGPTVEPVSSGLCSEEGQQKLRGTFDTLLANLSQEGDSSARPEQLSVILEHLNHVQGASEHTDAVWSFVTNMILRAPYLDGEVQNPNSEADDTHETPGKGRRQSEMGFDLQLQSGLRNLARKLQATTLENDKIRKPRMSHAVLDTVTAVLSKHIITTTTSTSTDDLIETCEMSVDTQGLSVDVVDVESNAASASQSCFSADDGGDHIRVFVRMRPLRGQDVGKGDKEGPKACVLKNSQTTLKLNDKRMFTYDEVMDSDTTQDHIFQRVGRGVVNNCLQGFNGTIFAYGQTGSGKTYTMNGPNDSYADADKGLMPRCFDYLFQQCESNRVDGQTITITCSFLEIYNERIYDLLTTSSQTRGLQIREDVKNGVLIKGLSHHSVTTALEAFDVLQRGLGNRRVASTTMNRESSRSHAVFTLNVKTVTVDDDSGVENTKESQLNLIDLAGSERQRHTKASGTRLKEAGNINKSLSVLGNVITALVHIEQGRDRHIPYRDSKLTFLLRDSLGGNTKTFMIANVNPASTCGNETLSTLQFAQRAKLIENKASVNEHSTGSLKALQDEIKRLKKQLHDTNQLQQDTSRLSFISDAIVDVIAESEDTEWSMSDVDSISSHDQDNSMVQQSPGRELLSPRELDSACSNVSSSTNRGVETDTDSLITPVPPELHVSLSSSNLGSRLKTLTLSDLANEVEGGARMMESVVDLDPEMIEQLEQSLTSSSLRLVDHTTSLNNNDRTGSPLGSPASTIQMESPFETLSRMSSTSQSTEAADASLAYYLESHGMVAANTARDRRRRALGQTARFASPTTDGFLDDIGSEAEDITDTTTVDINSVDFDVGVTKEMVRKLTSVEYVAIRIATEAMIRGLWDACDQAKTQLQQTKHVAEGLAIRLTTTSIIRGVHEVIAQKTQQQQQLLQLQLLQLQQHQHQ